MTRDKERFPSDVIPVGRNKMVKVVAVKHWGHSNHMNSELLKDHPTEKDLETYCLHLMKIHDTTIQSLKKRLLEHLLDLSKKLELPVNPEKKDNVKALTIDSVHSVILNSSNVWPPGHRWDTPAFPSGCCYQAAY